MTVGLNLIFNGRTVANQNNMSGKIRRREPCPHQKDPRECIICICAEQQRPGEGEVIMFDDEPVAGTSVANTAEPVGMQANPPVASSLLGTGGSGEHGNIGTSNSSRALPVLMRFGKHGTSNSSRAVPVLLGSMNLGQYRFTRPPGVHASSSQPQYPPQAGAVAPAASTQWGALPSGWASHASKPHSTLQQAATASSQHCSALGGAYARSASREQHSALGDKRSRHQTQPGDVDQLVDAIDRAHAALARGRSMLSVGRARKPPLAFSISERALQASGSMQAAGGSMQAGHAQQTAPSGEQSTDALRDAGRAARRLATSTRCMKHLCGDGETEMYRNEVYEYSEVRKASDPAEGVADNIPECVSLADYVPDVDPPELWDSAELDAQVVDPGDTAAPQ